MGKGHMSCRGKTVLVHFLALFSTDDYGVEEIQSEHPVAIFFLSLFFFFFKKKIVFKQTYGALLVLLKKKFPFGCLRTIFWQMW